MSDEERAEACLKAALGSVGDAMVPAEVVMLMALTREHNLDPAEMVVAGYLMGRADGDPGRVADFTHKGEKLP